MTNFLKYLLKPGYILTMTVVIIGSVMTATGFMIGGAYKVAYTIVAMAALFVIASAVGSFLRWKVYQDHHRTFMNKRMVDNYNRANRYRPYPRR